MDYSHPSTETKLPQRKNFTLTPEKGKKELHALNLGEKIITLVI